MGRLVAVLCAASILVCCGCRPGSNLPELGEVTGVVTLDGEPVQGAEVIFVPDNQKRSRSTTDADGRYELVYDGDVKGAALGGHTVLISKPVQPFGEALPHQYNLKTNLRRYVEPGPNVINFQLTNDEPEEGQTAAGSGAVKNE